MSEDDNHIFSGNRFRLLLALLWVVLTLSLGPSIVAGSDGPGSTSTDITKITECGEITEPGRYELTKDIENDRESPCIEITGADSVVFDGNGYTIEEGRVGVRIRDSTDVVVKYLSVNESKRSGLTIWDSEDIEIHGNTITKTGTDQIWWNNSIHSWKSSDVDIYDNTVLNSFGHSDGIYVGRGSDVNIYENQIENASFRAISSLESKNIVIDRNSVENPDTDGWGIMVHDIINITATNNSINRAMYGIEAKENSTDVVFKNNEITNTTLCSLEAEGSNTGAVSNVVIADNTVESAGPLGIWVNTSNIIVTNNTVTDAHGLGMYIKGSDENIEIYGNKFINSNSAAIWINVTRANLHIYENDFRELSTGIQLLNSADISIERNRFTSVTRPFEEKNSTGIEYRDNTVDETDGPSESYGQSTSNSETDEPSNTSEQSTTEGETDEPSDPSDSSGQSGAGFGISLAILGILLALLSRWME